MKNTCSIGASALVFLLCMAGTTRSDASPAAVPRNVDIYATADIGNGQQCKVGARTDQDGLNERPVVYLAKADGGFAWHAPLPMLKNAYQGRATHCVATADSVYVLVQTDTDSHQATSQTLLKVFQLDRKTGKVIASKYVDAADISNAYTEWVEEGGEHFKLDGNALVITGNYQLMSDRDSETGKDPTVFTVKVSATLSP